MEAGTPDRELYISKEKQVKSPEKELRLLKNVPITTQPYDVVLTRNTAYIKRTVQKQALRMF